MMTSPVMILTLVWCLFLLMIGSDLARAQMSNSVSTSGLLVGKGSHVREPHDPLLSEPVMAPLSHSAPISPSEMNFAKKRRRRHAPKLVGSNVQR